MKKIVFILLSCFFCAALLLPGHAAAETDVYTLVDEDGNRLTQYQGECDEGDEYISGDNLHYRVTAVDKKSRTATAKLLGDAGHAGCILAGHAGKHARKRHGR